MSLFCHCLWGARKEIKSDLEQKKAFNVFSFKKKQFNSIPKRHFHLSIFNYAFVLSLSLNWNRVIIFQFFWRFGNFCWRFYEDPEFNETFKFSFEENLWALNYYKKLMKWLILKEGWVIIRYGKYPVMTVLKSRNRDLTKTMALLNKLWFGIHIE